LLPGAVKKNTASKKKPSKAVNLTAFEKVFYIWLLD